MPNRNDIEKVMIIGSGPIVIGQACEFDYSGTQACKALRKLGYRIVLVNSNPATIMTDPGMADATYLEPLTVDYMQNIIEQEKPDLVLGFGGGKVLDVAKLAAGNKNTTFISIPTTLSNDGISSPVAVIKDKKNIPVSHITKAPYGIIVDISIVKKAPEKHIKAGIGDLISNLSAVFDARLAHKKGRETITSMALSVSEAGPLSLLDFKKPSIHNDDFLLCLAQGLTKSGIAMCITGSSRPASGSEHKISHAIDHLHSPRHTLHGEQTGIAAIFTMALQENSYLDKVIKFYTEVTFPHTLDHLSLTLEQFIQVVHAAGNIRPQRYTILEDIEITDKKIREIVRKTGL